MFLAFRFSSPDQNGFHQQPTGGGGNFRLKDDVAPPRVASSLHGAIVHFYSPAWPHLCSSSSRSSSVRSSAVREPRSTRSGRCLEPRSRSGASWTGRATATSPSRERRSASTWPSTSLPPGKAGGQPSDESLQETHI